MPVGWRLYGYLTFAIVVVFTAWPVTWQTDRDSFPLSSYPMFSRKLPKPEFSLQYALGKTADGTRYHLAPELVANAEPLQASMVLARAVYGGAHQTRALCQQIARRVARAPNLADVVHVHIVTGRHDAVAYLTGRDKVGVEKVHGRCLVKRAQPAGGTGG